MAQMNEKLARIYFDVEHPAGFSSQAKLAKAAGVSLKQTREWLAAQDAYIRNISQSYVNLKEIEMLFPICACAMKLTWLVSPI
jgi:hypothetical protein